MTIIFGVLFSELRRCEPLSGREITAEEICGCGAVIGTRTGGSAGNGVRVEPIPGHSYADICYKHNLMSDGTDFVGTGIVPDMEAVQNYESYFKDNKDAVLKAAVKYLRELSGGK